MTRTEKRFATEVSLSTGHGRPTKHANDMWPDELTLCVCPCARLGAVSLNPSKSYGGTLALTDLKLLAEATRLESGRVESQLVNCSSTGGGVGGGYKTIA